MTESSNQENGAAASSPGWLSKAGLIGQIFRFGIVGVAGFAVNAGVVEALARFIGPGWAQVVAFPLAASSTWWLNRRFTFEASKYSWHQEWLRYVVLSAVGWAANNGTYFFVIFHSALAYHRPSLAVAAGSLAGMVFNFGISKWLVFK